MAHAKVLAVFIIDESAGLMAIEVGGGNDEIGNIEGEEPFAIEPARISLRQHERLAHHTIGIDMAEIRPSEKSVVTAGT